MTIGGITLTDDVVAQVIRKYKTKIRQTRGQFYFPGYGESFWSINGQGDAVQLVRRPDYRQEPVLSIGAYRTSGEAEFSITRRKALVRIWSYVQKNMKGYLPDSKNISRNKYSIYYDCRKQKLLIENIKDKIYGYDLPCFDNKKDAMKCLSNCAESIKTFLGIIY